MLFMEESAGYQRILEKGVEKGFVQGRDITLREVTLKLLKKKSIDMSEECRKKLERLDVDTLNAITDNIFEINTVEDLKKFLD